MIDLQSIGFGEDGVARLALAKDDEMPVFIKFGKDPNQSRQVLDRAQSGQCTDPELPGMLYQAESVLLGSHGEGFGLPHFEAAYSGLPVIAPDWSGHVDFLYMPVKDKKTKKEKLKAQFARVKYTLQHVQREAHWDGVIEKDSMWCYPEQGSYKMNLREVYKEYDRFKNRAKKLNKWIRRNFTAKQQYKKVIDVVQKYVNTVSEDEINKMFSEINEAR